MSVKLCLLIFWGEDAFRGSALLTNVQFSWFNLCFIVLLTFQANAVFFQRGRKCSFYLFFLILFWASCVNPWMVEEETLTSPGQWFPNFLCCDITNFWQKKKSYFRVLGEDLYCLSQLVTFNGWVCPPCCSLSKSDAFEDRVHPISDVTSRPG